MLQVYVQKGIMPLSIMVTFDVLNVWKGSHDLVWLDGRASAAKKFFGERVTIPPYSAMIFRQDLVHAGTAYDSENLRLHLFLDLDVDYFSDDPGSIKLMDASFFRMK